MPSSLVPEKPLLVYPSLASTLGLEESLLLCTLADRVTHSQGEDRQGFRWFSVDVDGLLHQLPFWGRRDLQRICTNLRDKGVLISSSPSLEHSAELRFAFNEKLQSQLKANTREQAAPEYEKPAQRAHYASPPTQTRSPNNQQADVREDRPYSQPQERDQIGDAFLRKNFIAPNWQPDATTLAQLAQHSIPSAFALQHVPEFITYWRERGEAHHSWGSKFMQHTLRQWRKHESERHKKNQETPIQNNWQPSHDALEILIDKGAINKEFIEDAIPEFILYWRERGDSHRTWNTKFVQHVRVQWAKFTAAIENNTDPRPVPENWQPSEDVYDVLRLANIDVAFARSLIPEFVLYWRDRGALYGSWNTKYLQHTKHIWAQRHNAPEQATNSRQTRDIRLEEELTDRSWAS